jgi:solute carrier family 25 carnitine/acylcarnitine transporter 20/29
LEQTKRFFHTRRRPVEYNSLLPSYTDVFVSGFVAGLILSVVTIPSNVIKVQLQTTTVSTFPNGMRGILACGKWLYKNEGIAGLYRGGIPQIGMETIGRGCYFLAYDWAKKGLGWTDKEELSMGKKILAASCAGVAGWATIYPLDVIKNRIQAQPGIGKDRQYKGVVDCVLKSYRAEGPTVFFRGFQFTLLRAAPVSAVLLPVYDTTHSYLMQFT